MSKQKEREKQEFVKQLDESSADERYMKAEKQKAGIDNWWKSSGEKQSEYVTSEDYRKDTEEERLERIQEFYNEQTMENDVLDHIQNKESVRDQTIEIIDPQVEESGYYSHEDFEEEGEESMYDEPEYQDENNI